MDNPFDSTVDHFLTLDLKKEFATLEGAKSEIIQACASLSIPCAVGSIAGGSGPLFSLSQDSFKDHSEYLIWLRANKPSFVAMIPKLARYSDGTDGMRGLIVKAAEEAGKGTQLKAVQEAADNQRIAYDIYAFFSGGQIGVNYQISCGLDFLFSTDLEDDFLGDDDDSYLDDFEQLSEDQVRENAVMLAESEGFNIAKNQAERRHLAHKVFGEDIDSHELDKIAREAGPIYKMEVLPAKVRDLALKGLDAKQIADQVGESLPRIKQIVASL